MTMVSCDFELKLKFLKLTSFGFKIETNNIMSNIEFNIA